MVKDHDRLISILTEVKHVRSDIENIKYSLEAINGDVRQNTAGRNRQSVINRILGSVAAIALGGVGWLFGRLWR